MSSSFGKRFVITTFGESHGKSVGVIVDGVPAGLSLDLAKIQKQLSRRRPGQSTITTPRQEPDEVIVHSGTNNGMTLGSPIMMMVENTDHRPEDYDELQAKYRPSHADFTTMEKYGIMTSGGGRSSARETIGRVAGGAIAEQLLNRLAPNLEVVAWVQQVQNITCEKINEDTVTRNHVDHSEIRCPSQQTSQKMRELIDEVKGSGDSVGGIIRCVIRGVPPGLGEPVFDKIEADLAKAMMSIPATKGFEIGSGFLGSTMRGSVHNDPFEVVDGKIRTTSNHSGGIQGGITNGEFITFNVAFKPAATIAKLQNTIDKSLNNVVLSPKNGRHDPCVLPRAVPIVEAMAALVLADHWLRGLDSKL